MQMKWQRNINASRDAVWRALNDPEVLKACIPGCEELERHPAPALKPASFRRSAR